MIFKKKIKSTFFLLSTLLGLLILVGILIYTFSKYPLDRELLLSFFDRSYLDLRVSSGELQVSSSISSSDQDSYKKFLSNLGAQDLKTLTLKLDPQSLGILSQSSPERIYLHFNSDKDLKVHSRGLPSLSSSLPETDYSLSSSSSSMDFRLKDNQNYSLELEDPYVLLNYATSSGRIYFSSVLNDLFPILEKVATISLTVSGQNLSGEIKLK